MDQAAEQTWEVGVLKELADLGLVAARDLQGRLVAAGEGAEAASLAHALDRVSRSVRLSVALKAKLERRRAQDARAAADKAEEQALGRRVARRVVAQQALERRINAEVEDEHEAERLVDDADERIELAAMRPGFETTPVEEIIARVAAEMGLDALAPRPETPPTPAPTLAPVVRPSAAETPAGSGEGGGEGSGEVIEGDFAPPRNISPGPTWPLRLFPSDSS